MKLLLFTIFILSCLFTSGQWTQLYSGSSDELNDVFFIDSEVGFVVGEAYTSYPHDPVMLKTTDGGQTWNYINTGLDVGISSVWFITDSIGFISERVILKTTDQGSSWDTVCNNPDLYYKNTNELLFINDSVGYYSFTATLKTVDGGNTWTQLNYDMDWNIDFDFSSEDIGLAAGYDGQYQLYFTQSAGNPWFPVLEGGSYSDGWVCVDAITDQKFIAIGSVGWNYEADISTDGIIWNSYSIPSPPPFCGCSYNDMIFTSESVGWIVGAYILKTEDGGYTWAIVDSLNTIPELNNVYFPSAEVGYAVGTEGLIMKYVQPCQPFDSVGIINGASSVCEGDTVNYLLAIVDGASAYQWNVPLGSQLISSNGNEATIVFGNNSGDVTVNVTSSCDTISTSLSISVSSVMALFTLVPDSNQLGLYYGYNLSTGNNLTYIWNWGDGATSSGSLPEHTYADSGYYNICLVISDTVSGCTDEFCANYQILKLSETEGLHQVVFVNWPVGTPQAISESIQWDVFPNPVTSNLTIEYSLLKENEVSIQLSDITGKNLRTIFSEKRGEGKHREELNLDGIAAGIYMLKLQSGGKIVAVKIIKQ